MYDAPICSWDLLCRPADWLWRTCCKMDSPFHYNWPWDLGLGCSACCTFVLQLSWIRAVGSMAVIKQRAHWKCPVTVAIAAAKSYFYVKCSKMCFVTVWPFLTKFEYRSHQNYLLRCKFYCYFLVCWQASTRTVFQCTWPTCGKLHNSCSGIEKHVRQVHLG